MFSYVIKRLLAIIPTFFGMTIVAFVIMNMAPGGPVEQMVQKLRFGAAQAGGTEIGGAGGTARSTGVNEEILEALRKQYGFDKPIIFNLRPADRRTAGIDRVAALLFSADLAPDSKPVRDLAEAGSAIVPYVMPALLDPAGPARGLAALIEENGLTTIRARLEYLTGIPAGIRGPEVSDQDFQRLSLAAADHFAQAAQGTDVLANLAAARRLLAEIRGQPAAETAPGGWDDPVAAPVLAAMGEIIGPAKTADRPALEAWWREAGSHYQPAWIDSQIKLAAGGDEEAGRGLIEIGRIALPELVPAVLDAPAESFVRLQPVLQAIAGRPFALGDLAEPEVQTDARESMRRWWKENWLLYTEVNGRQRALMAITHTRYATWLRNILTLDFGNSFTYEQPVIDVIKSKMPVSIWFGLTSFVLSYLVCIPLGIWKAVRDGSTFDYASSIILFILYSIPGFVLGIMLIVVFGGGSYWDLIPIGGFTSDNYEQLSFMGKFADKAHHMLAPLVAYMVASFTGMTMLMKNSIIEEISKDYCRTARAKGLSATRVYLKHALRNALIPLVVGIGGFLIIFFAGSFLIEKIFNLDGMGLLGYTSVLSRDFNVLLGEMVIFSIIGLTGRLISDFIYTVVDPRIDFAP